MRGGIFLFVLVFMLVFAPAREARAQFVEEIGTLESLYESRARAVLNSFLRPYEYTVVVSADIDRDEKALEEYREKMEVQFLPGLPIPADPQMMPAQNKLHSLKTKVEISLVLAQEVPAEKEKLLKDILVSKLHLDETAGDKTTVSRAPLPKDIPQAPPQILPELSWKTWTLILLLALLALAGIIFWATTRKGREDEEEEGRDEKGLKAEKNASRASDDDDIDDEGESDDDDDVILDEDVVEAREKVIAIATQYPVIASKVAREMIDGSREEDVIAAMETIGWDLSKKLFNDLGPRAWARIGASVRRRETLPSRAAYQKALSDCYRLVLSRVLELGGERDEENPFSFLIKASPDERARILRNESPANLAIVLWYCAEGDLNDYFESLDVSLQAEITLSMARLDELPAEAIRTTAQKLAESLQSLRQKPIVKAEGPRLAAQVLRSFTPEKEMEIIAKITRENPSEAERIRRATVQFTDLNLFPVDALTDALADVDADTMTSALVGCEATLVQDLLAVLPKKKAMMIERDLQSPVNSPSAAQVGATRREITARVEAQLKSMGVSLEEVWARVDATRKQATRAA